MHASNPDYPHVLYVADAYCGWCWGFSERLVEFAQANRDKVRFGVISGGLFVGERAGALADYPHIPAANTRIAQLTGAHFGAAYQARVAAGTLVMDSSHAGAALAALRRQAPERAIHWVHALQAAFYTRGLSLSDPDTLAAIARDEGLDAQRAVAEFSDGTALAEARQDFATARQLGVSSYPTLLFVHGNRVQQLPGTGATMQTLTAALDVQLAMAAAQWQ